MRYAEYFLFLDQPKKRKTHENLSSFLLSSHFIHGICSAGSFRPSPFNMGLHGGTGANFITLNFSANGEQGQFASVSKRGEMAQAVPYTRLKIVPLKKGEMGIPEQKNYADEASNGKKLSFGINLGARTAVVTRLTGAKLTANLNCAK